MEQGSKRGDVAGYPTIEEAALLFRRLRHRFMNDIQVVYGWLQLDEPSRALDYLVQCRDQFLEEGQLWRLLPEEFTLPLMDAALELRDRQRVLCRYRVADGESELPPATLRRLSFGLAIRRLLLALADVLATHGPGSTLDVVVEPSGRGNRGTWEIQFVGATGDGQVMRWREWDGYGRFYALVDSFAGEGLPVPDVELNTGGFAIRFAVTG